ncbi:hypothetical protein DPMN_016096 [Dreissena polymorpha]|uniref:Uncharacterized protein n=1 Tax=Dreissena polymorpha TaxID=45954 RepID=A0A9D4NCT5_DREPO|nr:hypothetical protein DPMN_016096 [Dreissena polymorpha]
MLDTAYTAPQGTGTYSKTHTVWVKVAHGLHKASIIILGVLVLEVRGLAYHVPLKYCL